MDLDDLGLFIMKILTYWICQIIPAFFWNINLSENRPASDKNTFNKF